ncbi:MAG: hypothetical protein AAGF33_00385 [Pseudomonadota bacterium]
MQAIIARRAFSLKNMDRFARGAATVAATAAIGAVVAVSATAGTDTTFGTIATQITGWLEGSLGVTLAIVSLIFGIGSAVINFNWKLFAGSIGVALAAALGPGIVSGTLTAII